VDPFWIAFIAAPTLIFFLIGAGIAARMLVARHHIGGDTVAVLAVALLLLTI